MRVGLGSASGSLYVTFKLLAILCKGTLLWIAMASGQGELPARYP